MTAQGAFVRSACDSGGEPRSALARESHSARRPPRTPKTGCLGQHQTDLVVMGGIESPTVCFQTGSLVRPVATCKHTAIAHQPALVADLPGQAAGGDQIHASSGPCPLRAIGQGIWGPTVTHVYPSRVAKLAPGWPRPHRRRPSKQ